MVRPAYIALVEEHILKEKKHGVVGSMDMAPWK